MNWPRLDDAALALELLSNWTLVQEEISSEWTLAGLIVLTWSHQTPAFVIQGTEAAGNQEAFLGVSQKGHPWLRTLFVSLPQQRNGPTGRDEPISHGRESADVRMWATKFIEHNLPLIVVIDFRDKLAARGQTDIEDMSWMGNAAAL
jgi:hypothetical protein